MAALRIPGRGWSHGAAVLVALVAGCGSRGPAKPTPQVAVVAQPFALAEVARRVGLGRVAVSDHGAVVLSTGGDPNPWLDPVAMQRVSQVVAETLAAADPAGRGSYEAAARAYQAQLGSLDIDYRSSLADCGRHDIVTADLALAPTGARYGFTDHAAREAGVAGLVAVRGIKVVFGETGVAPGAIEALAQATGTKVDQLDTLTVRTAEEAARGATYLSLMTDNLAKLRTALACVPSS
jgi:zinc transport system substrate-binding protein